MNNATCQINTHEAKRIISICFHTECKGMRVCCQMCLNEKHKDHTDQLVNVEEVLHFIKTQSQQPSVLSTEVNQRLSELQNALKDIDEISKLIKDEIQILGYMHAQQFFKNIISQHNILEQEAGSIGSEKWNQLIEDILSNVQIRNCNILYEQSTRHISKSIAHIHDKSIELEQELELIQNKILFQNFSQPQSIEAHTNIVRGIDICKQKNLLVCGADDQTVKVWDLKNNTLIKQYSYSGPVYGVVFSNQGNFIAFGGGGDFLIKLIDISNSIKDGIVFELRGHKSWINRLAFSNNSKFLITGSADKTVIIWDVKSKKISFKLETESCINGISVKADDSLIGCNQSNGIINIWNFYNQKLMCQQQTLKQGTGIQFSNDQQKLVTSDTNGIIRLWSLKELNQGQLLLIREYQTASKSIWTVLFSPCSRFIISICNIESQIKIIDSYTNEVVKLFKSNQNKNQYLYYSSLYLVVNIFTLHQQIDCFTHFCMRGNVGVNECLNLLETRFIQNIPFCFYQNTYISLCFQQFQSSQILLLLYQNT